MRAISIEGYTPDEILAFSDEQIGEFVVGAGPLVLRTGSAEILGEFRLAPGRLVVELAHIDGGGEGVLPALWMLTERYAKMRGLSEVEWIVHALNCAKPNLKLSRVLKRRGFIVTNVPDIGEAYHFIHRLSDSQ